MSIAPHFYGQGLLNVHKGLIDMDSDSFKLSLHSGYTPNQDTDAQASDLSGELATASGYTAGGVALASPTLSYDAASNQVRWDFSDPTWTFSASKTFDVGVIRKIGTVGGLTDPLLAYLQWSPAQTVNGVYVIQLDPLGLLYNAAS